MAGKKDIITTRQKQEYEQNWTDFMVRFWQERMLRFRHPVYDTGQLYHSLKGTLHPGPSTTIEHHFLEYGIYVAAGVGREYSRDASRREAAMQRKTDRKAGFRERRDWFSKKYMYSLYRLQDFEARYYGEAYQGLVSDTLSALFGDPSALARSNGGNTSIGRTVGNL